AFDHDTFNSCAATPTAIIGDGSVNFSLTNSTWINSVGSFSMAINCNSSAPMTTGSRLVDNCIFDSTTGFSSPLGFTITNNVFEKPPQAGAESVTWASFDGNFVLDDDGGTV